MKQTYYVTPMVRIVNSLMQALLRLGIAPARMHLLTVRGRKTGNTYTTPVSLVEANGQRWLVAPYGEVSWVKNARAAGQVTLARGQQADVFKIEQASPEESAPILKTYIHNEAITRPYFEVAPDAPVEDFAAIAAAHPVFRLVKA
ncbi:MAG: nitroreductase family deazaflavin-dependent oxidoreductase [Anaerolineae bacterium]|nr:nitroreductase family deazaflavin-dependent oxidoreductase [Anaerolineae bacterium]